jgi:Flp pilus assembly protein TadD
MKKQISLSLIVSILLSTSTINAGIGEWVSEQYINAKQKVVNVVKNEKLKPINFEVIYPVPFYKTSLFKWGSIAAASVVVAIATVSSGGAAGVPGATWIGSLIGGVMGTTWTAGLAALGGGALTAGGFGMAGGAVVIATMTDLSLAVLIDQATSIVSVNEKEGKNFSTIKISIPKWKYGSKKVLLNLENIYDLQEKMVDEKIDRSQYARDLTNYMSDALRNINITESKYDAINGAILAYDLGKFEKAEEYLSIAQSYFPKNSSFISYMKALVYLSNNDLNNALLELNKAIAIEPEALNPYLLKINILLDQNNLSEALRVVKEGLKGYDDDSFQLNYLGGMISLKKGYFLDAIDYFKDALSNTTINPIEAECKMSIAIAYKKLYRYEDAEEWYEDAIEEIEDREFDNYRKHLIQMYNTY